MGVEVGIAVPTTVTGAEGELLPQDCNRKEAEPKASIERMKKGRKKVFGEMGREGLDGLMVISSGNELGSTMLGWFLRFLAGTGMNDGATGVLLAIS